MSDPNQTPDESDINISTQQFMTSMNDSGYDICVLRYSEDGGARFSLGLLDFEGCAADFITHHLRLLMRIHAALSEGIAKAADEVFLMAAGGDAEKAEQLKQIFSENVREALANLEITDEQEENQSKN